MVELMKLTNDLPGHFSKYICMKICNLCVEVILQVHNVYNYEVNSDINTICTNVK